MAIWNFSRGGGEPSGWVYVHYVWTLAFWLALLAFPALMVIRHRQSLVQQGQEPIDASLAAKKLWYIWVHGLTFTIVCLFALLVVFAVVFVGALVIMAFGIIIERRIDSDTLVRLMLYVSPVWIPLAVGASAHYSERLKLPGYRRVSSNEVS